jgi:hypothetical protein
VHIDTYKPNSDDPSGFEERRQDKCVGIRRIPEETPQGNISKTQNWYHIMEAQSTLS